LRVWAAPIKIFRYNNLSGANSVAVCILAPILKKQAVAFLKELLIYCLLNGFLVAIAFKGIRRCVQAAKQQAVRLSLDCINGKYLWALPTPTTFEKVDQTSIVAFPIYSAKS